jgi:hypothetical protein
MPKDLATRWFSSIFTFPKATLPAYSPASCSIMGETILHGPHHGAQKSTSMSGYFETTSLKFESVRTIGLDILFMDDLAAAIFCISVNFLCLIARTSLSSCSYSLVTD